MQNDKEKTGIGDRIIDFVQKNRKGIFITLSLIAVLFAGLIVFIAVSEQNNKKAIAEAEVLNDEFNDLRLDIINGEKVSEANALIEKTRNFSGNKKGFPAGKAWSIIAQIYSIREDWQQAEEAWVNCANAGAKTYLGPIAFFNAAAAAEEQGKHQKAIEYLKQCVAHKFEFPDAPRAQFNIGRLYEQLGNSSEAMEAYRTVLINWSWEQNTSGSSNVNIWQNLARNQIIKLEIK